MGMKLKPVKLEKLTESDIGRVVVYKGQESELRELGYITKFNDSYIFVDYRDGGPSKATHDFDLQFVVDREI